MTGSARRQMMDQVRLRCGEQLFPAGFHQRDFCTHRFASVWILEGNAQFTDHQGRQWHLAPGDCVHRFPGQVHSLLAVEALRSMFVALPGPMRDSFDLLEVPGITQQVCHPGLHPDLIGRQRRLSQDLLRTPPHRLGAIAILLQQWVVDLHYRLWRDDDTVNRAIEEACVRLADEDARTLSMPQLAAAVGLGYSTFRTRFKAHTGLSPAAYRIRLLMNTAQHLLSSTRDDCSDIAKQLGYPDLYSFSSQFKQVVGVSPSQWRRSGG